MGNPQVRQHVSDGARSSPRTLRSGGHSPQHQKHNASLKRGVINRPRNRPLQSDSLHDE